MYTHAQNNANIQPQKAYRSVQGIYKKYKYICLGKVPNNILKNSLYNSLLKFCYVGTLEERYCTLFSK